MYFDDVSFLGGQPAFYTAAVPTDPRIQPAPQAAPAARAPAPGGAGQPGAWQTQAGWHKVSVTS